GGFIIMSGLVLATMYNNVLSSKIDVKTKSKLMRLVLVPLFGLGLVISTNTFEARSRIEGLWAYYQEELKDQSIVASRTDVWTYSLRTIQQYPLLGVKNSGEKENIPPQYRASGNYVAHNVFLDYGRYSGIPGMLLIAYFFFHPILKLISHRRHQLYYGFYFAYFVMFIFWMTLSFQFYKTFWVLWMLLAVAESNLRILALPRQNAGRAVRPGTHRRARRAPTHPARSAAQSRPSEPKEEPNERTV
ncbi:MAG: O-antigen ligase family protein, partial [Kiritimatiellae bacterium]|nr:O-antigen ligase family protein [Kiritimatiellia bacterium]